MLNRRHKAALFITLLVTGCALLAGATLAEGLRLFILGTTFAWVFGSNTVSKIFTAAKKVPGQTWPSLRFLLGMVLGSCLFLVVAIASNFNSFLCTSSAALYGMCAASSVKSLPEKQWVRTLVIVLGIVVFCFSALLIPAELSTLSFFDSDDAVRLGDLLFYALIALLVGMYWLIKGWRLILAGINVDGDGISTEPKDGESKGSVGLYISLFIGALLLTVVLGAQAFSAFSHSVYPAQTTQVKPQQTPLGFLFAMMLLAAWPYSSWKSILARQLNTNRKALRLHKAVTGIVGGLFATALCVAITFGIQNGTDRRVIDQIENSKKGFQEVAARIGSIKDRDLKTTQDYIDAYEEMEPALNDFDVKLTTFTGFISAAEQRDKARGPLNIQKLYAKHDEWTTWNNNVFGLLRQDIELNRKQIQVVRDMSKLPADVQVEYWKEHFQPLAKHEDTLRQQIAAAQKTMPK